MFRKDYIKWKEKKSSEFMHNMALKNSLLLYTYDDGRGYTIVYNIKTGKTGVSKCNLSKDKFDIRTGLAIAWARYRGEEIPVPFDMVTFTDLKLGSTIVFNRKLYTVSSKEEYFNESNYGKVKIRHYKVRLTSSDSNFDVLLLADFENEDYNKFLVVDM